MMKSATLFVLGLAAFSAHASECGNIQYLDGKSQGVDVIDGKCNAKNEIGLGTVFRLGQGARLWLKSTPKPEDDADFQLVCQSASSAPLEVTVSSPVLPWITPNGLKNCSGWVDNKLKCDGTGGSNVFYCAIAAIGRAEAAGIPGLAMTTSVKMRTLSAREEQRHIDKIAESMAPEIGLCRHLFQIDGRIAVEWTVDTSGRPNTVSLTPVGNDRFSDCVAAVVKNFSFPQVREGLKISHTF